jgi:hypothetical protein
MGFFFFDADTMARLGLRGWWESGHIMNNGVHGTHTYLCTRNFGIDNMAWLAAAVAGK